jgi:hypothetical protein
VTPAPRVRVEPFRTGGTTGDWTVRWRVINDEHRPIRLLSAQHPHSQFRTPATMLDREVRAGQRADLALPVRFVNPPGAVVENPFLVLTFHDRGDWRLLARVRVTAGPRGEPLAGEPVVQTIQKVGARLSR